MPRLLITCFLISAIGIGTFYFFTHTTMTSPESLTPTLSQSVARNTRTIAVSGYAELPIENDTLLSFTIYYGDKKQEDTGPAKIIELQKALAPYYLSGVTLSIGKIEKRGAIPTSSTQVSKKEVVGDVVFEPEPNTIDTPDGTIPIRGAWYHGNGGTGDLQSVQEITLLLPTEFDSAKRGEIEGIIKNIFAGAVSTGVSIRVKSITRKNDTVSTALREIALADARKNAEGIALLLGGSLGDVITYAEGGSETAVYQTIASQYPNPLEPQKYFLTVQMVYELASK